MINENRIVPIEKVDLISMYGLILLQNSNNSSLEKLAAGSIDGDFAVNTASKVYLADQPLKTLVYGAAITGNTIFFVPDYAFDVAHITKTGATLTITKPDEGIHADGHTLYKGVLSTNALTITKVGF